MSGNTEMCSAPPCNPRGGQEAKAEGAATAAPVPVRGKPASWVVVPIIKKTVFPNAFGADEEEAEQSGARHLIKYDGERQSRGEFLERLFPGEYKKYPYKVQFKTDDIFRLGGN
ncbi:MAG: hypothetical protein ACLTWR_08800 [Agathobaculum desmolans]|uniref:hypothetical protein n=1 Tax=Agathobaculum desmolans TaxID=39484 RepID=UPI0039961424